MKLHGGAMGAIVMAAQEVRKCGTIQLTGIYGMRYNGFPLGNIFQRNVQVKMGQAHVNLIIPQLYQMVSEGKVNLADIVTHKIPLSEAKRGYEIFDTKMDDCIKVILKPHKKNEVGT